MKPAGLKPREELSEAFRPWMNVNFPTSFGDPDKPSPGDGYKPSWSQSRFLNLNNYPPSQRYTVQQRTEPEAIISKLNIPPGMVRGRNLKTPLASTHFERMEKLSQYNMKDSSPLLLTYAVGGERYIANPEYSHCDRETARWYNRTYGGVQTEDGGITDDEPPPVPQMQTRYGYDESKRPVMINCDGILVEVKKYMKYQFGKYYPDYKIKSDTDSSSD